jgi:hypothetical protein
VICSHKEGVAAKFPRRHGGLQESFPIGIGASITRGELPMTGPHDGERPVTCPPDAGFTNITWVRKPL